MSQNKYLGTSSRGEVILEDFEKDKPQLLWIKGKINPSGYFTLENCTQEKIPKTMTAMSSSILRLKGKCRDKYCAHFDLLQCYISFKIARNLGFKHLKKNLVRIKKFVQLLTVHVPL